MPNGQNTVKDDITTGIWGVQIRSLKGGSNIFRNFKKIAHNVKLIWEHNWLNEQFNQPTNTKNATL